MRLPVYDLPTDSLDTPALRQRDGVYRFGGQAFAVTLRHRPTPTALLDLAQGWESVRQLDITGNAIADLPVLPRLVRLYAAGNRWATLPTRLAASTDLETLILDRCGLTTFSVPSGGWQHLRSLSLYANVLTALPDDLGDLPALEHLSIGANPLGDLPASLWRLTGLVSLNLAHTGLTHLPDAVGGLRRLHMLDIAHNRLEHLPDGLADLRECDGFLYLGNNPLTRVSPALFAAWRRVQYLNLTDTRLGHLPRRWAQWPTCASCACIVRDWSPCRSPSANWATCANCTSPTTR